VYSSHSLCIDTIEVRQLLPIYAYTYLSAGATQKSLNKLLSEGAMSALTTRSLSSPANNGIQPELNASKYDCP
jgi:hypothetical protein